MNSRQEERKKLHKKDINHMYVAASALIEVASGKDRRIKELEETLKRKNQEVESLESRSFAAAQIHENNKQIISVLEMKLSNFKEIVHIRKFIRMFNIQFRITENLLKMTNLNMSETPGPKLLEHQMKKPESKEMEQQKSCQGKPIRKIY
uniref:Uncharacterized protein n=1 Tax=Caenorhabditis tropicalis TaxID=1561998 RepID=A0A1I7U137_9PELO